MIDRRRRLLKVRQHDVTDCGAACLCSVAAFYGRRIPLAVIRQYAGTDRSGTSLRGLQAAAERLGFAARGVRAPMDVLGAVPLPAIAHVTTESGWSHFVVLCSADSETVTTMDPADGELHRIPREQFAQGWSGVLLLIGRRDAVGRGVPGLTLPTPLARFWRLAAPHRRTMLEAGAGAATYAVLGLATAVFVQKLVDEVLPARNGQLLGLLGLAMLGLVLLQVYLRCVRDLLVLRSGQAIDAVLISGYFEHLLRLPQRFFDTMRVGEIVSRLGDAVKVRVFVNEVSLELVVNTLVVGFSFGAMLLYSWRLAALIALSFPLYLLIYRWSNARNRRLQRAAMEAAAEMEAHVVETVGGMATVRRLDLTRHAARAGEQRLVRMLRPLYGVGVTSLASSGMTELVSRTGTTAVLWVGSVLVLRDLISTGELMSFFALNGYMAAPLLGLIGANRQVQDALVAADRLFEIMELEREVDDGSIAVSRDATRTIRLEGVHFRYGTRPELFRGLDLVLSRQEITAIVGESGCGKSTLAALLHRAYDPGSGRILIDEVDVRHVSRRSLLRCVEIVPQDVLLLSGTLMENLAPGEDQPDVHRALWAARRAGLDDLIASLPAGLTTLVGERGIGLSGGQRQRVAIARALYRNPALLVLDEVTSGLDATAEATVHRLLIELREEGMGIVLITHRLGSASMADRIVVLHGGVVAEEGRHLELIQRDGPYQRLWRDQSVLTERGQAVSRGKGSTSTPICRSRQTENSESPRCTSS